LKQCISTETYDPFIWMVEMRKFIKILSGKSAVSIPFTRVTISSTGHRLTLSVNNEFN